MRRAAAAPTPREIPKTRVAGVGIKDRETKPTNVVMEVKIHAAPTSVQLSNMAAVFDFPVFNSMRYALHK